MFDAFRCAKPVHGAGLDAADTVVTRTTPGVASSDTARLAKKRKLLGPSRQGTVEAAAVVRPVGLVGQAAAAQSASQAAAAARQGGGLPEKLGDAPLRLIIVGHNPSETAWRAGHYYANPSNRFWPILRETGIAPPSVAGPADDDRMPADAGVGLTDVGSGHPGTDSLQFKAADFAAWRTSFFGRLRNHMHRASEAVPACSCGTCGAPTLVAFSGKRQFVELFPAGTERKGSSGRGRGAVSCTAHVDNTQHHESTGEGGACGSNQQLAAVRLQAARPAAVGTGRQWVLPEGWPLPLSTEVWVMTSTSGAAAMTKEQRIAPWRELAERLAQEPWPRRGVSRCGQAACYA